MNPEIWMTPPADNEVSDAVRTQSGQRPGVTAELERGQGVRPGFGDDKVAERVERDRERNGTGLAVDGRPGGREPAEADAERVPEV